ncbi:MAG: hypothetical protein AB1405_04365 [Bdellovibrionota bacterium]
MKKPIIGFLAGLGLLAVLGAGTARAECKICLGASFEGFGYWSHVDQVGGATLTASGTRAQQFFAELPVFNGGTMVPLNVGNISTGGGDTDFGAYAGLLALNGVAAVSEHVDLVFRFAFIGTGYTGAGGISPATGDPPAPGGSLAVILEQGYVDAHTADGTLGLTGGRFEPRTGRSFRQFDTGSPFLSIARTRLLPTFLTGGTAYWNSGELGAALYLYNDLNGVNVQDDVDMGYGAGLFYDTDALQSGITAFLSPERITLGLVDQDNELWVFILNGTAKYSEDALRAWADLTWRRDGHPSEAIQSGEAFSAEVGGAFDVTDELGVGMGVSLSGSWTRVMDTTTAAGTGVGHLEISGITIQSAFVRDGDIFTLTPAIVFKFADRARANIGWNLESMDGQGSNELRRNIHTIFLSFAAEVENGTKHRANGLRPVD